MCIIILTVVYDVNIYTNCIATQRDGFDKVYYLQLYHASTLYTESLHHSCFPNLHYRTYLPVIHPKAFLQYWYVIATVVSLLIQSVFYSYFTTIVLFLILIYRVAKSILSYWSFCFIWNILHVSDCTVWSSVIKIHYFVTAGPNSHAV